MSKTIENTIQRKDDIVATKILNIITIIGASKFKFLFNTNQNQNIVFMLTCLGALLRNSWKMKPST